MTANSTRAEVIVITGASAGVGRATACAFARQGASIGLLARGKAGLDGALRDVERLGGRGMIIRTDVGDPDQVEAAAEIVEKRLGPIDVWVNNAMCSVFSPVKKMTAADYKRVTDVTYLGFVYGTLAALKRMLPRNRGTIIQVGSALTYRSIPLQSAYCAGKHAIAGFTDSLRCELIHDKCNVKVTMVHMPAMNTPQFDWVKSRLPRNPQPVPPIYQPDVAAEAIVHAASHYRREWLVGTSTVVAVQGNKVAPNLGDHYLGAQGYDAQQWGGKVDPDRVNNLYEPVDEEIDYGAHGAFNQRARGYSLQLWLDQHRRWVALAGFTGALCSSARGGIATSWRGTLVGLAVGAAGVLGLCAFKQARTPKLPTQRPIPHDATYERNGVAPERKSASQRRSARARR